MSITLGKAIRNAVEAEWAGARLYTMLARKAPSPEASAFFTELAVEEEAHAAALDRKGRELDQAYELELADPAAQTLESAPSWVATEGMTVNQAFELALAAEEYAALFYFTLADATEGEVRTFFRGLAKVEEGHAAGLRGRRTEILG